MAAASGDMPGWFWAAVLTIGGFGVAYTLVPEFKKAVNGLFGEFKKGTTINPKEFEKQLPEGNVVPKKPVTAKTGCYNVVASGKAGTCWRNIPCGGKTSVAWCITGSDRCSFARTIWAQKFGCKSSWAQAYEAEPWQNVTVA